VPPLGQPGVQLLPCAGHCVGLREAAGDEAKPLRFGANLLLQVIHESSLL
jgi:hypothetical protein